MTFPFFYLILKIIAEVVPLGSLTSKDSASSLLASVGGTRIQHIRQSDNRSHQCKDWSLHKWACHLMETINLTRWYWFQNLLWNNGNNVCSVLLSQQCVCHMGKVRVCVRLCVRGRSCVCTCLRVLVFFSSICLSIRLPIHLAIYSGMHTEGRIHGHRHRCMYMFPPPCV